MLVSAQTHLSDVGCLCGCTAAQVMNYATEYDAIHDQWWDEKSKNRHTRLKLRSIFKRSVVDTFCIDLYRDAWLRSGPDAEIVVVYGAATFSPSGKGNLTVPTTGIYKAFKRAFPVVELQEEFRTTLNCHKCHTTTENVWERCAATLQVNDESVKLALKGVLKHGIKMPKACHKVRGLRFCPNCVKYLNRDMNGSINIGNVWRSVHIEGQGIPKAFDRKHCMATMKRKR